MYQGMQEAPKQAPLQSSAAQEGCMQQEQDGAAAASHEALQLEKAPAESTRPRAKRKAAASVKMKDYEILVRQPSGSDLPFHCCQSPCLTTH